MLWGFFHLGYKNIKILLSVLLLALLWSPAVSQAKNGEDPIYVVPIIIIPVYPDATETKPQENEPPLERQTITENSSPPAAHCKQLDDVYVRSQNHLDFYKRNWDCNRYTDNGQIYTQSYSKVFVNFDEIYFEQLPIVINGNTLVPLRKIAESLSTQVEWEPTSKTITLKTFSDVINLQVDNSTIRVNGKEHSLEAPPTTVNGLTFVPLRAIAESLGAKVNYDPKSQKVHINSRIKGKVTEVYDGGILKVNTGAREDTIRLNYLSVPKQGTNPQRGGFYFKEALEYIRTNLLNKMVELELDGIVRDEQKHLYAYVWVDGNLFNQKLLKEGFAELSSNDHRGDEIKYTSDLSKAQTEAKDLKKGIWSDRIRFMAEGERTNRNYVMEGFAFDISKGTKSNEAIVKLEFGNDDDRTRYGLLSENAKKEVIFYSITRNAKFSEKPETAIVTITYKGKTYAEAVIQINKALEENTYRFYNEGK